MLRLPDLLDRDKERLGADATAERSLIENVLLADRLLQDSSTPTASSGTTVLLVYLRGSTIYIASVGDTRRETETRAAISVDGSRERSGSTSSPTAAASSTSPAGKASSRSSSRTSPGSR